MKKLFIALIAAYIAIKIVLPAVAAALIVVALVVAARWLWAFLTYWPEQRKHEAARLARDAQVQNQLFLAGDPRGVYGWPS